MRLEQPRRGWIRACGIAGIAVLGFAFGQARASAQQEGPPIEAPSSVGSKSAAGVILTPELPVGGALIIEVSDGTQPIVQVGQIAGEGYNTYGGSLRMLTATHWAWQATPPLQAGSYEITVATSLGTQQGFEVMVVDGASMEPPEVAFAPDAQWVATESQRFLCEHWSGSQLTVQGSFLAATAGEVIIAPGATSEAPRAQVDQYLYRLTFDGDAPHYVPFDRLSDVGPFVTEADEYCFGLELLSASTGEVLEIEAHTPTCVPHGDLPSLILDDATVPDRSLSRFVCEKPPERFEARWCALNDGCEAVAQESLADEGCVLYGHVCRGEGLPARSSPPASSGGSGGAAGMSAGDDGGIAEAGGGGCSVVQRRARSALAPLVLSCVLGLVLRRRRDARACFAR